MSWCALVRSCVMVCTYLLSWCAIVGLYVLVGHGVNLLNCVSWCALVGLVAPSGCYSSGPSESLKAVEPLVVVYR